MFARTRDPARRYLLARGGLRAALGIRQSDPGSIGLVPLLSPPGAFLGAPGHLERPMGRPWGPIQIAEGFVHHPWFQSENPNR